MNDWQKRMKHAIAQRNALAVCNDISLESFKDTEGTMQVYSPSAYQYNGVAYWKYVNDNGHTHTEYEYCSCKV